MQAIIFDCDGTLADTMPAHYEAWLEVLSRYGLGLDEDRFYALGGWPTIKVAELLLTERGVPADPLQVTHDKEAVFEQMLDRVRPIEPVVEVVHKYHGQLPLAVATGGMRRICEQILRHIGLHNTFDAVVCCEDVTNHKPHPDVFLEAARRLNAIPAQCRVYEDTDPGIEAARRAGMESIDVRTFFRPRRVTGQSA